MLKCGGLLVDSSHFAGSNPAPGPLSKSITRCYLWRFGMKLRHSIRATLGAPLSNGGLE